MRYAMAAAIVGLAACGGDPPGPPPIRITPHTGAEAVSLLGDSLRPAPMPDSVFGRYEENLRSAEVALAKAPNDPDAIIWLGRRTAYLGRYRDAIDIFSAGIERHPGDARMYRHRGHRYITTRQLDKAVEDLNRAVQLIAGRQDEVEPDGIPNSRNSPTGTLQFNVWYHLGLAYYLRGELEKAADAYQQALTVSRNPDTQVATRHWLYMTLRRLDRGADARTLLDSVSADVDLVENTSYHRLLLMYKGLLPIDSLQVTTAGDAVQDATIGYGIANWHLYGGRRAEAELLLRKIVAGPSWAAFGHIAAEAELARAGK